MLYLIAEHSRSIAADIDAINGNRTRSGLIKLIESTKQVSNCCAAAAFVANQANSALRWNLER